MEIAPRISVDEKVRFGKLAGVMTYEEVISEYEITRENILVALDYAPKTLANEEIRAVS